MMKKNNTMIDWYYWLIIDIIEDDEDEDEDEGE